jgi:hypothetical protein
LIICLENVSAQMNGGVISSRPAGAPGYVSPALMAFVAAASTHDNVPGKRHGIELE